MTSLYLFLRQMTAHKVEMFNDVSCSGPPDVPKQCKMFNQTSGSVSLVCAPGYGGGLHQHLHVEAGTNIFKKNWRFNRL